MTANSNSVLVFSPDSNPYGLSYTEWTAKWWQWALSIPVRNNPVTDKTGENCAINQKGPVWFLAGTLGGEVVRTCTIPADKAILMPILNHGELADSPPSKSEEELLYYTTREMDIVSDLEVMIDNVKLSGWRYRVRSPIFDVILPEENLFGGTAGPTRGASDGYWLFLRPFAKGKHKIHSFGSCLSGKVRIGVNYDITAI
jgi:hypothetical protein